VAINAHLSDSGGLALTIELNLLIALLKTTKNGLVSIRDIKKDVRIASNIVMNMLGKLQREGVIYLADDLVRTDAAMRIRLTIKALSLGADIESTARLLRWQEFEEIAAVVLERNEYVVQRNVRFKQGTKRREIDVVGCRNPIVVCVDCKHWKRALSPSSLKRIVSAQSKRTRALAESVPSFASKLVCQKWRRARFVPVILSLSPGSQRFHDKVPIVPVLQFQDFVNQLPVNITTIEHIEKVFGHLGHAFQD